MLQNEKPAEFSTPAADQFRKKKFNLKALIAIAAVVVIACSSFLIVNEIQKNKLQKKLMRCDWYNYENGIQSRLEFDEYSYTEFMTGFRLTCTYKPVSGSKIKVTEMEYDFASHPDKVNIKYKIDFNASMTEFTMTYKDSSHTWRKN